MFYCLQFLLVYSFFLHKVLVKIILREVRIKKNYYFMLISFMSLNENFRIATHLL